MEFSLVEASGGYSLVVVASLVTAHGLQGVRALVISAHGLSSCGSQALKHRLIVVALGLNCSMVMFLILANFV